MSKDFFWRSDDFRLLSQVAGAASHDPALADFAEFCRLRERGLRDDAMAVLTRFIDKAAPWPLERRRPFIDWLMSLPHGLPDMVMPRPLIDNLALPTLQEWIRESPNEAVPRRWLGILTHNADLLEEALNLDPEDQIAKRLLVDYILNGVEYAVHELPTGYLGKPANDLADLDRAAELAAGLPDARAIPPCLAEIEALRELVLSYKAYRDSETKDSFSTWAAANSRPLDGRVAFKWKRERP